MTGRRGLMIYDSCIIRSDVRIIHAVGAKIRSDDIIIRSGGIELRSYYIIMRYGSFGIFSVDAIIRSDGGIIRLGEYIIPF
ncbi:hypothetical protein D3C72_949310 [compost metagenome]